MAFRLKRRAYRGKTRIGSRLVMAGLVPAIPGVRSARCLTLPSPLAVKVGEQGLVRDEPVGRHELYRSHVAPAIVVPRAGHVFSEFLRAVVRNTVERRAP